VTDEKAEWTPFEVGSFGEADDALYRKNDPGYIGVFVNSRYQVVVREQNTTLGKVTWLAIVRRDRQIIRDWRDLQRIKNELTSPEAEGVEIFPKESRLVDTSNQYHLFVLPTGLSFPFGYAERDVSDEVMPGSAHQQRAFESRPDDINTNVSSRKQYKKWEHDRRRKK
jgi:hypothetical protein